MPLNPRIDDEHRQHREQHARGSNRIAGSRAVCVVFHILADTGRRENVAQEHGQRLQFRVVQIQDGREEFVPEINGVKHADGQENGHGQRQDNSPQHLQIVCAIHARGFLDFLGYAVEEAFHDQRVVDAHRGRQDDGENVVLQSKFRDEQIVRHETWMEHVRDEDQ